MTAKILIIEDESAIADNIIYALSTEGLEPVWCATGREARNVLYQGGVALVILDIGLPDINGFELCREIRSNSRVPIIFLTARTDEIDRVVGLEMGGDDYVLKPFSPRELSARVKAVLRRYANTPQSESRDSPRPETPFLIDEERRSISYFDTPLELRRYEYNILKALAGRPGRVFSREQLMQAAWDEPDFSLERTVDAHIKNVRNKLKAVRPDLDPIQTRRGFGYCLRETW